MHARLDRWQKIAGRVHHLAKPMANLSDAELLKQAKEIRWRAKTGIPLHRLLPEAYAMVVEASRRTVDMTPYPVQIRGATALFEGGIAEMQTGEGKTLTAVCPAFLRALSGRGCHIITVNDYLARRDAETMGPIYQALGLSTACIQTPMETDERRDAYSKDITYGTAKEMGFDYLRDRLRLGVAADGEDRHSFFGAAVSGAERPVQRGHYYVIADEADSILIDEARTPLIIGLTQPNDPASVSLYRWCQRAIVHLEANVDFVYEPQRRSSYLTDAGCRRVLLMPKPALIDSIDTERIYKHVEQALTAKFGFVKDRDYVIVDDEIMIVDEGTGRIMEGRKWQDGLHQTIEAKELVTVTAASGEAARITIQNYFKLYTHLSGMTGTAIQAAREIRKTYGLPVTAIPTHRPCIRYGKSARIFIGLEAKWHAIVDEIGRLVEAGRPVLVGTPSIEASERLGQLLKQQNIKPIILNAKYHEQEAEIVKDAGHPGRVTVATNMAGRGTDIVLADGVADNGGLHVIATEMHSSARIDRQLIGRAARQGDPGGYQFFLSLEDELLSSLEADVLVRIRQQANPNKDGELPDSWLSFFKKTQRFIEKTHLKQRKDLLRQEKHRTEAYKRMGLDPCLELTET